ncbi:hypothetical protein BDZ45DRAFT_416560 [Acephala macrosclerotiorum]|nr:hypothetical protein BDZ45DRAFT_416560 [Acephala macrosclerotiorum]
MPILPVPHWHGVAGLHFEGCSYMYLSQLKCRISPSPPSVRPYHDVHMFFVRNILHIGVGTRYDTIQRDIFYGSWLLPSAWWPYLQQTILRQRRGGSLTRRSGFKPGQHMHAASIPLSKRKLRWLQESPLTGPKSCTVSNNSPRRLFACVIQLSILVIACLCKFLYIARIRVQHEDPETLNAQSKIFDDDGKPASEFRPTGPNGGVIMRLIHTYRRGLIVLLHLGRTSTLPSIYPCPVPSESHRFTWSC